MALKANVKIETDWRNGKTILKNVFCHSPFKVMDVTETKSKNERRLMLMSSSPGVLDNDDFNFEITVAKNCSLCFETQSYQRLFQMEEGARQNMVVTMEQGSRLRYLPHPVVPHKASIFCSRNKIVMADNCSLLWAEVLSAGRKVNDELFRFTSYRSATEVFMQDKLVLKENLWLNPGQVDPGAVGQLEGFTHQSTLFFINGKAPVEQLVTTLAGMLGSIENVESGISALAVNGLVVRMLGYKAEQLFDLHKQIAMVLEESVSASLSKPAFHV